MNLGRPIESEVPEISNKNKKNNSRSNSPTKLDSIAGQKRSPPSSPETVQKVKGIDPKVAKLLSSSILKASHVTFPRTSLPTFAELERPNPKENLLFERLAQEVRHWCEVPRSEFDKLLREQSENGSAVNAISTSKSYNKINFNFESESDRLRLARLVANGEIDAIELIQRYSKNHPKYDTVYPNDIVSSKFCQSFNLPNGKTVLLPTWNLFSTLDIDSSFWVQRLFDVSSGVTPFQVINEREATYYSANCKCFTSFFYLSICIFCYPLYFILFIFISCSNDYSTTRGGEAYENLSFLSGTHRLCISTRHYFYN